MMPERQRLIVSDDAIPVVRPSVALALMTKDQTYGKFSLFVSFEVMSAQKRFVNSMRNAGMSVSGDQYENGVLYAFAGEADYNRAFRMAALHGRLSGDILGSEFAESNKRTTKDAYRG